MQEPIPMKSTGVALLWCLCFIGLCGLHRIYVGRVGTGILWLSISSCSARW
jgi:TM2 domain-containing membrane protein YozV